MADPLSSLIRPNVGPQLPAFERFAPPPPENVVAAQLAARTAPGDVVIDTHGRGGWIARNAIAALRRVYALESTALTRLLAEVVLRPPDLRHFDAGLSTVATHPRGEVELKRLIEQSFTTRCPTCGRPVVVQEYIWDTGADAPSRKVFRCSFCREQARSAEPRIVAVDDEDIALAKKADASAARDNLKQRFPVLESARGLPDELLDLFTPRTIVALDEIVTQLDVQLKAPAVSAGLKLALIHALVPASRLNGYPGRAAALRIRHGHVQQPTSKQWRERNPWLAFEEGCHEVRAFISSVEVGAATFQPRPGDDIETLIDGTANVVLRTGAAYVSGNEPMFWSRRPVLPGRLDPRSRVRLVLTQPPVRWSVENISFAYLATAVVLGREAASQLPLEWVFGAPPPNDRGREATALRRSLLAVRPVLARDAKAVVLLDRGGASGLVAGVLGGVGAGFRLNSAVLAESGNQIGGVLEFNVGPPEDDSDAHSELADLPTADPDAPFALADVEAAVTQVAVSVLKARGEPASGERLLGEVLVGLDRLGHLRHLVGTQTFGETEAASERFASADEADDDADEPRTVGATDSVDAPDAQADADEAAEPDAPNWALGGSSATDHVRLLMEIVMGELRRADHPRLVEIDKGRWWLRSDKDLAQARPPLSDRLEWAAYGLVSTTRGIDEETYFQRVAGMFRGHDTPDADLVRAVLDSYRDPSSNLVTLRPQDELTARHAEHGEICGMLVEYGHRLGLRAHVSARESRRAYMGGVVGDLLSEEEQRAYLPLIAGGDPQTLEALDCVWYLRGKATFLFEVEWTAMLTDALLRRGPRIPADDSVVRFLVIPPERAELVRFKLARSPLLAKALEDQNWHILKSDHLRRLVAREEADLDLFGPMLGLDPEIERAAEQLALF
jgi:hypothetical protein